MFLKVYNAIPVKENLTQEEVETFNNLLTSTTNVEDIIMLLKQNTDLFTTSPYLEEFLQQYKDLNLMVQLVEEQNVLG